MVSAVLVLMMATVLGLLYIPPQLLPGIIVKMISHLQKHIVSIYLLL